MTGLITSLPHMWPWLSGALALGLPSLVRECRRLITARAVSRLGRAAIDKDGWSDRRFEAVLDLIRDVDSPGRRKHPPKADEPG